MRRGGSHHQKLVRDPTACGRRRRRRLRRRHRPLPRPPRRRPPPRRPPGHRDRRQLRRPSAVARRAGRAPRARRSPRSPTPSASGGRTRTRSTTTTRCGASMRKFTRQPRHPDPLPPRRDEPAPCGPHAVQVLRTYPAKRPAYPFAPEGERSIARAYLKALPRARRLVYLEDQYFWSERAARALADALRAHPELHVVVVVPRFPDRDGRVAGPAARIGRERATAHRRARRRRPGARLRPRERGGHPHLRARQGLHRRRRLADGRLRQHEPPLVDPRLRAVVRGPRRRPTTSASRATRPDSATVPGVSPATPGCSSGASTSVAPRPTGVDDLLDPDRALRRVPPHRAGARRVARGRSRRGADRPVTCASTNPTTSRPGTRGGRTRCPASSTIPTAARHGTSVPTTTDRPVAENGPV